MSTLEPTVFVVDDEAAVRDSLRWLIESVGLTVETFDSGAAFVAAYNHQAIGCLILDIRMPAMSGLEVQQELAQHGIDLPIVFLTGHGDVHLAVRAMKAGAFDFVEKPYNDQVLLDLIQRAISQHGENRESVLATDAIQDRWERLTPRERQIMNQVVDGKSNRVIAEMLEISEKTIEFHRANVMEKMEAESLAELIRLAVSLERTGHAESQGLPQRKQEAR